MNMNKNDVLVAYKKLFEDKTSYREVIKEFLEAFKEGLEGLECQMGEGTLKLKIDFKELSDRLTIRHDSGKFISDTGLVIDEGALVDWILSNDTNLISRYNNINLINVKVREGVPYFHISDLLVEPIDTLGGLIVEYYDKTYITFKLKESIKQEEPKPSESKEEVNTEDKILTENVEFILRNLDKLISSFNK